MDDARLAQDLAPKAQGVCRSTQGNRNAQMASESPDSGHGRNTQPPRQMVRLKALGWRPLDLHTRKVGEMTLQNVVRMLFGMGVALLFAGIMSIAGAIETAGL
jgi:hypothetical protein